MPMQIVIHATTEVTWEIRDNKRGDESGTMAGIRTYRFAPHNLMGTEVGFGNRGNVVDVRDFRNSGTGGPNDTRGRIKSESFLLSESRASWRCQLQNSKFERSMDSVGGLKS
jgi:hypothetical protein